MTLVEIKQTVEEHFKLDMLSKSRRAGVVTARRIALWYATENGYKPSVITAEWGIGHDVVHYHNAYINDMIRLGDKETCNTLWNVFGVDVTKDLTKQRLQRINNYFDELLMTCPESKLSELRERVELMIHGYNYVHVPQQAEVVESNAIKIE